jgi:hypothetical protein
MHCYHLHLHLLHHWTMNWYQHQQLQQWKVNECYWWQHSLVMSWLSMMMSWIEEEVRHR